MLTNGLQHSVLLLYAGPEITGSQLVFALVAIVALLAALINGYKFYLNKKSQELIQSKGNTKQSSTLRKYDEVQVFEHSKSVLLGGLVTSLLVIYLTINWTNVTLTPIFVMDDNIELDDLMIEPPNTPPTKLANMSA